MKFYILLLSNSVFNPGEKPYTAEDKKVRHIRKERIEIAAIAVFNNELISTFQF
jgi:hypothetical protein